MVLQFEDSNLCLQDVYVLLLLLSIVLDQQKHDLHWLVLIFVMTLLMITMDNRYDDALPPFPGCITVYTWEMRGAAVRGPPSPCHKRLSGRYAPVKFFVVRRCSSLLPLSLANVRQGGG